MADIELVIKIPKELKEALDNATKEYAFNYLRVYDDTFYNALKNGIPLPKGHGRLVDIDLLRDQVSHDEREAFSKHQVWLLLSVHNKKIPTIIETDKEQEEDGNDI